MDNVSNKTVWSIFSCYQFQLDSQGLNTSQQETSAPSLPQFPHLVVKVRQGCVLQVSLLSQSLEGFMKLVFNTSYGPVLLYL